LFKLDTGEILDGGRDEYDWCEDGVVDRPPVNGVVGRPDVVVEEGVVGRPLAGGGPRLDRKGEMLDRVERVDISPSRFARESVKMRCAFCLFEFSRVLIGGGTEGGRD
jgi:hypothetical protein